MPCILRPSPLRLHRSDDRTRDDALREKTQATVMLQSYPPLRVPLCVPMWVTHTLTCLRNVWRDRTRRREASSAE
jgi:hypothetical protein